MQLLLRRAAGCCWHMGPPLSAAVPAALRQAYDAAGQGHVFSFVDRGLVPADGVSQLVAQLEAIDPVRANSLFKVGASLRAMVASMVPLQKLITSCTAANTGRSSRLQQDLMCHAKCNKLLHRMITDIEVIHTPVWHQTNCYLELLLSSAAQKHMLLQQLGYPAFSVWSFWFLWKST